MLAVALPLLLLAGCGGSGSSTTTTTTAAGTTASQTKTALLADVRLFPSRVVFDFRTPPAHASAHYTDPTKVVVAGTTTPAKIAGSAVLLVTFTPASGTEVVNGRKELVYKGQRRLMPGTQGAVREALRVRDSGNVVTWAIGLDKKRQYTVSHDRSNVVVTFS